MTKPAEPTPTTEVFVPRTSLASERAIAAAEQAATAAGGEMRYKVSVTIEKSNGKTVKATGDVSISIGAREITTKMLERAVMDAGREAQRRIRLEWDRKT